MCFQIEMVVTILWINRLEQAVCPTSVTEALAFILPCSFLIELRRRQEHGFTANFDAGSRALTDVNCGETWNN